MQQKKETLDTLSNDQLLQQTRVLARQERELQVRFLDFIREIDQRKLHLSLGYPSLFEFLTRELKFSAGAAQRRIDAARLMTSVPNVREHLANGELNLMSLARTQSVIRAEEKARGQKINRRTKEKMVERIRGKSIGEATSLLLDEFPEATLRVQTKQKESLRSVGEKKSRLSLVVDENLKRKFNRVREITAHRLKDGSWHETLELLVDDFLQRSDPLIKAKRRQEKPQQKPEMRQEIRRKTPPAQTHRRAIPAAVRHAVWLRDRGQCQFKDPRTHRICGQRRFLEIDHIHAHALGGGDHVDNLRCICRAHNHFLADQTFGVEWMNRFRGTKQEGST